MKEGAAEKLVDSKPVSSLFLISLRLLRRDWKGGELRLLFLALIMAVTSITGIALFTDRLEKALLLESANMLAADRIVSGRGDLPREVLTEGQTRGLSTAEVVSFTSMAFSETGNILVAAKAVTDAYPLRGEVIISEQAFVRGTPIGSGPPQGEVWLESRAMAALDINIGDFVSVGEAELRVGKIIVAEPDRGGGSMMDNAGPRLMLHMDDLASTNVVQLGSRVSNRYLFAADDISDLDAFEEWFRSKEEWRGRYYIRDIRDESEEVSEALERAESFLLLSSLFAVLLAGVAIALTAKRYSERHYDYVAILKTFGCTSSQISFIYLNIQLVLASFAVSIGWLFGWFIHGVILAVLQRLLFVDLPEPGFQPFIVGGLTAVICLLSFALPPLLALRETPPLRVLRKDISQQKIGDNVPYLFGALGALLLVYWYSQDLILTSVLIFSVAAIALILSGVSYFILRTSSSTGMKAGSAWLLAMTATRRRRKQNVLQVMVFSITIMSLLILTLLRTDLVEEWQAQLPENTPNHFMMNITQSQIPGIESFFAQNGIEGNQFFPLVSARVTRVNGDVPSPGDESEVSVSRATLTEGSESEEPESEIALGSTNPQTDAPPVNAEDATTGGRRVRGRLSRRQVTWSTDLPSDNMITEGIWWGEESEPGYVSIEQEYAEWLDLELGDRLEFEVNQQIVSAEVSSFRSVRWDNMQPNFFIIFSPGTIDHLGATFLSTALMEREQKILLNDLVRLFPTVVVIEIDALIEQIQTIIIQVTSAIELISILVLLCGALVLVACVNASLDERFHENAILRTLGAGRKLILSSLLIEFASIGVVAGLIATLGAEASVYYLQEEIFEQEFSFHMWTWIAGPTLGMLIIAGLGMNSTREVVSTSPLNVLRRIL
ncbi:MAG: ABC transporter permease [Pseudohongiellaceae bacterium]